MPMAGVYPFALWERRTGTFPGDITHINHMV